jgi:hypothetical protein
MEVMGGRLVIHSQCVLEEGTQLQWLKEKTKREGNGYNYYQVLTGEYEGSLIQIHPSSPEHTLII